MILNRRRNSSPGLAKTWLVFTTSTITLLSRRHGQRQPESPSRPVMRQRRWRMPLREILPRRCSEMVNPSEMLRLTTDQPPTRRESVPAEVEVHPAVGVKVQVAPSVSLGLSSPTAVVAVTPAPAPSPSAPAEPAPAAPCPTRHSMDAASRKTGACRILTRTATAST